MVLFPFYRFRHPNLVEVMGFCCSERVKAVIYTFAENGSLYCNLHKVQNQNYSIFISSCNIEFSPFNMGATARSFEGYMQRIRLPSCGSSTSSASGHPVVSNSYVIKDKSIIACLLYSPKDKHYCAKICDFGFSLELPNSSDGRTLVTAPIVARSEGYFPPELLSGEFSVKYSYGVVSDFVIV